MAQYKVVNDGNPLLSRYRDTPAIEPDQIYIYEARFSRSPDLPTVGFKLSNSSISDPNMRIYICKNFPTFERYAYSPDEYEAWGYYGDTIDCQVTTTNLYYFVVVSYSGPLTVNVNIVPDYGGGGGGGEIIDCHFDATIYDSDRRIYVKITGIYSNEYDTCIFRLTPSSGSSYQETVYTIDHSFTDLPDGTYTAQAWYTYNGNEYPVSSSDGGYEIGNLVIGDGGGGGGETTESWNYDEYEAQTDIDTSGRTKAIYIYSGGGVNYGIYTHLTFASDGQASIQLSGLSGAIAYLVSEGNYGYNTATGAPFQQTGTEAGGSSSIDLAVRRGADYYLWISGTSTSVSGYVNVQISLTESPPTPTKWEEVWLGTYTVAAAERQIPREVKEKKLYRYNITFSKAGKVQIYSTGADRDHDVIAYLDKTNNGFDPDTGVPYNPSGTLRVWDDEVVDGVRNYNFNSGEIDVEAATYNFWVKGINDTTTAAIVIYIVPSNDTGKVWIYNGSSWIQATPYIYNGSTWVKATPYVYTGEGTDPWKKCT